MRPRRQSSGARGPIPRTRGVMVDPAAGPVAANHNPAPRGRLVTVEGCIRATPNGTTGTHREVEFLPASRPWRIGDQGSSIVPCTRSPSSAQQNLCLPLVGKCRPEREAVVVQPIAPGNTAMPHSPRTCSAEALRFQPPPSAVRCEAEKPEHAEPGSGAISGSSQQRRSRLGSGRRLRTSGSSTFFWH